VPANAGPHLVIANRLRKHGDLKRDWAMPGKCEGGLPCVPVRALLRACAPACAPDAHHAHAHQAIFPLFCGLGCGSPRWPWVAPGVALAFPLFCGTCPMQPSHDVFSRLFHCSAPRGPGLLEDSCGLTEHFEEREKGGDDQSRRME
jgi:hypothetical protein